MYQIIFFHSKKLQKDRERLQKAKKLQYRIMAILQKLAVDPFQNTNFDIKKIKSPGEQGTFRMRVGRQRVLYDVDTSNKTIIVYRIKERKEGYQ